MIERDKLPEQETIDVFMSDDDVQAVYHGLMLAERAYGGDVRAGIDAMVNKPQDFVAAVLKYRSRPNWQAQFHTVFMGGGGLFFGASAGLDLLNGSEDYFQTFLKTAIAVIGVSAAWHARFNRAIMAKQIQSITDVLDSTPATLNAQKYAVFLDENPQLKAIAEKLNKDNERPTMRNLVALKFHEIDLLGAVSS